MSDRQDIEAIMQAAKVAIPCVVTGFEQLAGAEPFVNVIHSINKKKLPRDEGQDTEFIQTAEILEVPILYPSTARFAMTIPIAEGDRGWLLHSDLDIDNWNLLDMPETASSRFHDLNDCVFMPGGWPRPKFMGGYSGEWAEMRDMASTTRVAMKEGEVHLQAGDNHLILTDTGFDVIVNGKSLVAELLTKTAPMTPPVVLDPAAPPERDEEEFDRP